MSLFPHTQGSTDCQRTRPFSPCCSPLGNHCTYCSCQLCCPSSLFSGLKNQVCVLVKTNKSLPAYHTMGCHWNAFFEAICAVYIVSCKPKLVQLFRKIDKSKLFYFSVRLPVGRHFSRIVDTWHRRQHWLLLGTGGGFRQHSIRQPSGLQTSF